MGFLTTYRYRAWLAASLMLLPWRGGLCQQIPRAEKHYQVGLSLEQASKFKEAADEFALAIDINPEYRDAYYHLGLSNFRGGETVGAIHALMQLMQLEPNNNQPRLALAQIYSDLGFSNDALALYIRAQQVDRTDPQICLRIGMIHFEQKIYPLAAQDFQDALELDPNLTKARQMLASVYAAQNDVTKAYQQLRDAATQDPRSPDPPSELGTLYLKEGKLAEAEEEFHRALALQPGFLPARVGLAKTYRLMGRLPQALDEASRALRDSPESPDALLERGTIEKALGKAD